MDTNKDFNITTLKATPLHVVVTTHFPLHIYLTPQFNTCGN